MASTGSSVPASHPLPLQQPQRHLDHLPNELLQSIVDILRDCDWKGLRQFSCVNRHLRRIALGALFMEIACTRDKTPQVWLTRLRQMQCADKVQHLTVAHNATYSPSEPGTDAKWTDLSLLIGQLPTLRDLEVHTPDPMPPKFLEVLGRHPSHIRLDFPCFSLRCPESSELHPADAVLLTSKHLHSISWPSVVVDHSVRKINDYYPEIADAMLRGAAPCLREMHFDSSTLPQGRPSIHPLPPKQPISGIEAKEGHKARLTTLRLCGLESGTHIDFKSWADQIDFSQLRNLCLYDYSTAEDNVFDLVAAQQAMSHLHTFACKSDTARCPQPLFRLLSKLPALVNLDLMNVAPTAGQTAMLINCGQNLRSLTISGSCHVLRDRLTMSYEDLDSITRACPLLFSLEVTLWRSLGSDAEVKLYRMIGRLRYLTTLTLWLNLTSYWPVMHPQNNRPVEDSSEELEDSPDDSEDVVFLHTHYLATKGQVRNALINAAVDGRLAKDIFSVITQSKQQHSQIYRLRRLRIRCAGEGRTQTQGFPLHGPSIMKPYPLDPVLAKSWAIDDDSGDGITVHPMNKPQPSRALDWCEPPVQAIVQELWPNYTLDMDWHTGWHSFPLQLQD